MVLMQDFHTPVAGLRGLGVFRNRKGLWRIRQFQASDILHVAELQASAFHDSLPVGVLDKFAYTMFKAEDYPGATGSDGSAAVGVSSNSCSLSTGRVVGVVEVGLQDEVDVLQHLPPGVSNYAYISSMAVAADARRAGIGRALLQVAEQQAALWQQAVVSLHVYDTNIAALKLYEKYGMKVLATDSRLRRVLGGKVRHLMVKDVAAGSGAFLESSIKSSNTNS
eukprot:gene7486-7695_t